MLRCVGSRQGVCPSGAGHNDILRTACYDGTSGHIAPTKDRYVVLGGERTDDNGIFRKARRAMHSGEQSPAPQRLLQVADSR
ncbi:hypothetical protein BRAS3843_2120010 [Bradyrhizobium sp. STM 3843]|nr:hypothetical protein BRAS3843_2120010 [Bradyrhizobium sp. STM 3843]